MSYKNKIFFGVGQGGTTAISGMGVYSLWQTGQGSVLSLEHLPSTLNDGTGGICKPTAILPISRDTFLMATNSYGTTFALDLTDNTSYAYGTDYSGYFESPLYLIGEIDFKESWLKKIIRFAKKLQANEGIQISYRINLTDSYTILDTFTYEKLGAVISHFNPTGIPQCEMIQIKIALKGNTTTPQFKEFKLQNYFMRGSQAINQGV